MATTMPTRSRVARQLLVLDVFLLSAAAFAAGAARLQWGPTEQGTTFQVEVLPTLLLVPLMLIGLGMAGCYRPVYAGMTGDTYRRYASGIATNVLLIGFMSYVLRLNLSRLYLLFVSIFAFTFGTLGRAGLRAMMRTWHAQRDERERVLVAGEGDTLAEVALSLDRHVLDGYRVVGVLTPERIIADEIGGFPVVGRIKDADRLAKEAGAHAVVAVAGGMDQHVLEDLFVDLDDAGVHLIVYPSLFEVAAHRVAIETVGDFPLLHVGRIELTPWKAATKRTVDVVVGGSLLLVFGPLMLVCAALIKRGSPGPVIFRQTRLGRDGEPFTIYKFRTMQEGAEHLVDEMMELADGDGASFKIKEDPRVTEIGGPLRKWSIDELPQLLNVFKGDMSMVGPRPNVLDELEIAGTPMDPTLYASMDRRRLRAKPGLTGPWQISGRSEIGFEERLRLDIFYIENWSLINDLFVIAKTVKVVLTRSGAY